MHDRDHLSFMDIHHLFPHARLCQRLDRKPLFRYTGGTERRSCKAPMRRMYMPVLKSQRGVFCFCAFHLDVRDSEIDFLPFLEDRVSREMRWGILPDTVEGDLDLRKRLLND